MSYIEEGLFGDPAHTINRNKNGANSAAGSISNQSRSVVISAQQLARIRADSRPIPTDIGDVKTLIVDKAPLHMTATEHRRIERCKARAAKWDNTPAAIRSRTLAAVKASQDSQDSEMRRIVAESEERKRKEREAVLARADKIIRGRSDHEKMFRAAHHLSSDLQVLERQTRDRRSREEEQRQKQILLKKKLNAAALKEQEEKKQAAIERRQLILSEQADLQAAQQVKTLRAQQLKATSSAELEESKVALAKHRQAIRDAQREKIEKRRVARSHLDRATAQDREAKEAALWRGRVAAHETELVRQGKDDMKAFAKSREHEREARSQAVRDKTLAALAVEARRAADEREATLRNCELAEVSSKRREDSVRRKAELKARSMAEEKDIRLLQNAERYARERVTEMTDQRYAVALREELRVAEEKEQAKARARRDAARACSQAQLDDIRRREEARRAKKEEERREGAALVDQIQKEKNEVISECMSAVKGVEGSARAPLRIVARSINAKMKRGEF